MSLQAARSTAGPPKNLVVLVLVRSVAQKKWEDIAELSSDFSQHWRDNSPSQAIVRKANQKIKETNF